MVIARDGLVREIREKPTTTDGKIVSTGIYSLDRSFFRYAVGPEVPDALQALILDGVRVTPVRAVDWLDAVNPWDLLEMNSRLLARIETQRAGTISRSSKLYGLIRIGKGCEIGPNTYIHGPVMIGEGCRIGPNCVILPNTSIGARVTIVPLIYVAHSLVKDEVVIGSHSRVIDAVIGEGAASPIIRPPGRRRRSSNVKRRGSRRPPSVPSCDRPLGAVYDPQELYHRKQRLDPGR